GIVPAADVLFGSKTSPTEARKNGGTKLLNSLWRKNLNAIFVSWQSGNIPFYIYLLDMPKMTDKGIPDLSGITMRSTPAYLEWFNRLGANNSMISASAMYTALQRGLVDGFAWPAISLTDLGVQDLVNYRIAPPVWQLDLVIMM